jgi:aryl-alcohol dehydrogenase-like predicted oxidoreductase
MTAYGVLSRGLLTGSKPTKPGDGRAHMPRFVGENAEKNAALATKLAEVARTRGVTPAQLAIAWVRAKGETQGVTVIPTVGARKPEQLRDALGALDMVLTTKDLAAIEAAIPASEVVGTRYPAPMMGLLDSER